ncbi:MAG: M56 family metallopeptidase [Eubacteriales bacterium]|nr:M56 family metallopeptidase [Eubacteriales bacterium]
MNNLLFTMTLTGSIPLIIFLVIHHSMKAQLSAKKAYLLLLLSTFFFVVPLPLCSYALRGFIADTTPITNDAWINFGFTSEVFSVNGKIVYFQNRSYIFYIGLLIWFTGFSINIGKDLFNYHRLKKWIKENCQYTQCLRRGKGIRCRKILIFYCKYRGSPFSTGFFRPIIVLPDYLTAGTETLILIHEYSHIRHLDYLVCHLAAFARALHWFNPFAHLLVRKIKIQQEFITDNYVMNHLDPQTQKKYGQLIFLSSTQKDFSFDIPLYVSSLTNKQFEIIEERIARLKNSMNHKKTKSLVVIVAMILSIVSTAIPILAYKAPFQRKITGYHEGEFSEFDYNNSSYTDIETEDFSLSDMYFTDENGNREPVSPNQLTANEQTRSCTHAWKNGTITQHIRNSDKSCDIIIYNAKKCSKCGNEILGSIKNTIHFSKCTH